MGALCALPALWVGLLYDQTSLDAAWDLVKDWSTAERQKLRDDVPKLGLKAAVGGRSVHDLARDVFALSRAGLARRKRLDYLGHDETPFLAPIEEVTASGKSPAEVLLERYTGEWRQSVEPVFEALAY